MPDLYNRPRPTVTYLIGRLRDRAATSLLVLLACTCLLALVPASIAHLPEASAREGNGETARGLPLRYRTALVLARPAVRLLGATGLVDRGENGETLLEAGAGVTQAGAVGLAGLLLLSALAGFGFREAMQIRVVLLVLGAGCLGPVAWRFGPGAYLVLALAGMLAAAVQLRTEPHPERIVSFVGWSLFGLIVDPVSAVVLPIMVAAAVPGENPGRRRLIVAGTVAVTVASLWLHGKPMLSGEEQAWIASQITPPAVLRRTLSAAVGAGGSILIASPCLALAGLGLGLLWGYDRRLARLSAGSALALLAARLVVVRDPGEPGDVLALAAPLTVLLAPAMGFGLVRLRTLPWGSLLLTGTLMSGLGFQILTLCFDPELPMRRIREGRALLLAVRGGEQTSIPVEDASLDRAFTPELSNPALSLACLASYLAPPPRSETIWISLPSLARNQDLVVDGRGMAPRPWPIRLLTWQPKPDLDPALAGPLRRSHGQKIVGSAVALALAILGSLSGAFLLVRLQRLQVEREASSPFLAPRVQI